MPHALRIVYIIVFDISPTLPEREPGFDINGPSFAIIKSLLLFFCIFFNKYFII